MNPKKSPIWRIVIPLFLLGVLLLTASQSPAAGAPPLQTFLPLVANSQRYVVLSWNDLGMHCYNRDFSDLAVLPPANTLYAQVIQRGDPPQLVTQNLRVDYTFPDNTTSVAKSNFWIYAPDLFNLSGPLLPNVGLAGKGLSGSMDVQSSHFIAEWIPLTEYRDDDPLHRYPYQLAAVSAVDTLNNLTVATLTVVAPVSTEMHCDYCHYNGGVEGISTGKVETNILTLHDREAAEDYPAGTEYGSSLMANRPVLCADCHSSNAIGKPGLPGIPSLSKAMHSKHSGIVLDTQAGCYSCHPGPETQCQRDVMFVKYGMDCIDCHGGMQAMAEKSNPWLNEPRCDTCHTAPAYAQNNALYRLSTGHGGLYCAACHDSPHAIAQSREANDAIKFIQLQGHAGTLSECSTCHTVRPTGPGPHGILAP